MLQLTTENFKKEVLQSEVPVAVDFWASWCGPCRMFAPTFEEVGDKLAGKASFAKLNVDDMESVAMEYRVMTIPTVIVFKGGQPVKKSVGVMSARDLEDMVTSVL